MFWCLILWILGHYQSVLHTLYSSDCESGVPVESACSFDKRFSLDKHKLFLKCLQFLSMHSELSALTTDNVSHIENIHLCALVSG